MVPLLTVTYLKMLFILAPFFVVSAFLSLTRDDDAGRRRSIVVKAALAVLVSSWCLLIFGLGVLRAFGVTLDAFRVGAGAILFLAGLSLVRDARVAPAGDPADNVAIVPLAIPVIVGPSVTGALLILGAEHPAGWDKLTVGLAVTAAEATLVVMLLLASRIERRLGRQGLLVLSKVSGLMIASLAAEMMTTGFKHLMT
ncbi:MAG: MarC family protein [Phycisphaerae bacterium]|nr:MarC family protein [Phycisphaerae bacterium]